MTKSPLPYWLVNVSGEEERPDARPEACPEFLLNLNERDKAILSTRDVDYKKHTWDEVVELASTNNFFWVFEPLSPPPPPPPPQPSLWCKLGDGDGDASSEMQARTWRWRAWFSIIFHSASLQICESVM